MVKRVSLDMVTYSVTVEKDEDGWLVSEVVDLPGCHTQAKTMDELVEFTKEAIAGYKDVSENSFCISLINL